GLNLARRTVNAIRGWHAAHARWAASHLEDSAAHRRWAESHREDSACVNQTVNAPFPPVISRASSANIRSSDCSRRVHASAAPALASSVPLSSSTAREPWFNAPDVSVHSTVTNFRGAALGNLRGRKLATDSSWP